MMKNRLTIAPATALGYNWHIRATSIAHATPPRKPFTLEYIARPVKPLSRLVIEEILSWFTLRPELDTSQRVAEHFNVRHKAKNLVRHTRTYQILARMCTLKAFYRPFRLLIHRSSRFFRRLSSRSDKSSGICDNANRAIKKSIAIPSILVLTIGTKASGTPFHLFYMSGTQK